MCRYVCVYAHLHTYMHMYVYIMFEKGTMATLTWMPNAFFPVPIGNSSTTT